MGDLSKFSAADLLNIVTSNAEDELKKRGYKYGWYKDQQYAGVIYILINPAFPNLVKIGYTKKLEQRLKEFNRNSGLPDPYHAYASYKVKKELVDLRLHNLIDSLDSTLRHAKNREFYEMSPEKAYSLLSAIAQINGDENLLVKNPLNDSFFDTAVIESETDKRKSPKKNLTFKLINIPIGSTLTYTKNKSITVKTCDDVNQVLYNGEQYSISALAKILLNTSAAQGGLYFEYKGKTLVEIRNEMEEQDDESEN